MGSCQGLFFGADFHRFSGFSTEISTGLSTGQHFQCHTVVAKLTYRTLSDVGLCRLAVLCLWWLLTVWEFASSWREISTALLLLFSLGGSLLGVKKGGGQLPPCIASSPPLQNGLSGGAVGKVGGFGAALLALRVAACFHRSMRRWQRWHAAITWAGSAHGGEQPHKCATVRVIVPRAHAALRRLTSWQRLPRCRPHWPWHSHWSWARLVRMWAEKSFQFGG